MSDDDNYLGDNITFLPYYKYGFMDSMNFRINIKSKTGKFIGDPVTKTVNFRGVESIITIDKKMVARVHPPPGTTDFQPNYFPYLEFVDIDFPWRYSPSQDNDFDQFRGCPWICLIVLNDEEMEAMEDQGISVMSQINGVDMLNVNSAYLPELKDIWGSAHAQLTHFEGDEDDLEDWVEYNPDHNFSRLLCLRKLEQQTRYHAFLVPTFHDSLDPFGIINVDKASGIEPEAWIGSDNKLVHLPVYYHWTFRTGEKGDFEYLVRQIIPGKAPSDIGTELVDSSFKLLKDDEKKVYEHSFRREGALVSASYLDKIRIPYHENFEKFNGGTNPKQDELIQNLNLSIATNKATPLMEQKKSSPKDKPKSKPISDPKKKKIAGKKKQKYQNLKPQYKFNQQGLKKLKVTGVKKSEVTFPVNVAKVERQPYKVLHQNYYIIDDIQERITAKKNVYIPLIPVNFQVPSFPVSIGDPIVTYPVYGRYYKHTDRIKRPTIDGNKVDWGKFNPWIHELNLDWRNRLAAGLGTLVVQNNQDEFMEECWEQVGQIRKANERLRRAKIAFDFNKRIFKKHLINLSREHFAFISSPFHIYPTVDPDEKTNVKKMYQSCGIPSGTITPSFMKVASKRNLSTQMFNAKNLFPDLEPSVEPDQASKNTKFDDSDSEMGPDLNEYMGNAFEIEDDLPEWHLGKKKESFESHQVVFEAIKIAPPIVGMFGNDGEPPKILLKNYALDSGNAMFFPAAIKSSLEMALSTMIRFNDNRTIPADFDPIMECPVIDKPMYRKIQEISPDYLMPGAGEIENNSIFILRENRKFIESFMIGLNHEMGRELLWREFPTDQRGTVFRHFWDYATVIPDEDGSFIPPPDIAEIHKFQNILGDNKTGVTDLTKSAQDIGDKISDFFSSLANLSLFGSSKKKDKENDGDNPELVLVIKADLVKRYPDLNIYGVFAKKELKDKDVDDVDELTEGAKLIKEVVMPSFRGNIADDTIIVGFPFDEDEIYDNDDDIYYIVIQENQELPCFGLDIPIDGRSVKGSDSGLGDLSWDDIPANAMKNGYIHKVSEAFKEDDDTPVTSSFVARRTYQLPVRVVYNIRNLLK